MANEKIRRTQISIQPFLYLHSHSRLAEGLSEAMAAMMEDRKYNDLILESDGVEFPVHRVVVCTQSEVLKAACEDHWKEGAEKVIHIEGFDPETVRRMVEFLYTQDYDQGKSGFINLDLKKHMQYSEAGDPDDSDDDDTYKPPKPSAALEEWLPDEETLATRFADPIKEQICVHAIADYYMIDDLKEQAKEKIKVLFKNTWWSAKGFLEVANNVFETTVPTTSDRQYGGQETLRDVIVRTAFKHLSDITHSKDFLKSDLNQEFTAIILRKLSIKWKYVREELQRVQKEQSEQDQDMFRLNDELDYMRLQNQNLQNCINTIRAMRQCRNCHTAFNVLVYSNRQQTFPSGDGEFRLDKYAVRCKACSDRRSGPR